MSWYRKVKSIYSISLVTISFIIWSTISKWIFQNPVDYKLFLITLCIVFCTQYLNSVKLKKIIVRLILFGLSIVACLIFFKGEAIFINLIFISFMIILTYSIEDVPINHLQYKEDITKSMVLLVFVWMISFTLGLSFVNEMYKFHILYIIMIIILMRETRRYVYDVKSKSTIVTNIIIGITVLTLSLDYAGEIIAKLLDILLNISSFILFIITSLLIKIFGGPISKLTSLLRDLFINRKIPINTETVIHDNTDKQLIVNKYEGLQLPPQLILIFKILILMLILYMIFKFLSRFRGKTKIYNGYVEEKERIVKAKKKKHWVRNLMGKIFEGGGSNREKILYTYKGFEKLAEEADIYKPYMTATQLKNVTKVKVDNVDGLEEMTQSYNEAKFSTHHITEELVEKVKSGYRNIKSQL